MKCTYFQFQPRSQGVSSSRPSSLVPGDGKMRDFKNEAMYRLGLCLTLPLPCTQRNKIRHYTVLVAKTKQTSTGMKSFQFRQNINLH